MLQQHATKRSSATAVAQNRDAFLQLLCAQMSESGSFDASITTRVIAGDDAALLSHEPSALGVHAEEPQDKRDVRSSGESQHKKHKKDRDRGADGEAKKEKKERVDYRALLCEGCRAALKLEDDEQMEDLDAVSKTQPALHHAVSSKHVSCLRAMLKIGNQIEGVNESFKGRTALHVAVLNCDVDCCQCLIDAGADGSPAWQTKPALHLAIAMRCSVATRDAALSIISHMLACPSFDPNLRDTTFCPPLCAAAAAADAEVVDALIKSGADPSFRDAHGCTALHLALVSGCASTIALLMPHMNTLQQNSDGATCYHLIAEFARDYISSINLQLSQNEPELADAANMTAADVAAKVLQRSPASEGPNFLFYDAAATRQHVADVSFCTEAASRIDVLVGELGVLLDASARGSATIVSSMPSAALPDLTRCHAWSYLSRISELSQSCNNALPFVSIDADTMVSSGSWEAARRSAGGVCAAVDAVLGRRGAYYRAPQQDAANDSTDHASQPSNCSSMGRAFVVARPPGHHCGYQHSPPLRLFTHCVLQVQRRS
jgi:hypothetical protein